MDGQREDTLVRDAVDLLRATGLFPESDLFPMVADCLTFMGKLVEVFEDSDPSVSKTAAVVLFVEKLRLDGAGEEAMKRVAAMVHAMQEALRRSGTRPS